jgi:putative ABC transport system substrate-binding protein
MKRRDVFGVLGGAAAWPLAAWAQPATKVWHIGPLMTMAESEPEAQARLTSLREGLQQLGWKEGHNVRIEPLSFCFHGQGCRRPSRPRYVPDVGS